MLHDAWREEKMHEEKYGLGTKTAVELQMFTLFKSIFIH